MGEKKRLDFENKKKGEEEVEIEIQLSDRQKKELKQLLAECEDRDQRKQDFFMEQEWNERADCPCFFLLYKKEENRKRSLVCAVSAFIIEEEAELSAVTQAERRGEGLFSKLLDIACSVLAEHRIKQVSIRIKEENKIGRQILKHWGWRKGQTDCLMVLLPEQIEKLQQIQGYISQEPKRTIKYLKEDEITENWDKLVEVHASAFGYLQKESEWIVENYVSEGMKLWGYWAGDKIIGICFTMETEQDYFLSAVSIRKEEQQKGHGEWFLQKVLIELWKQRKGNVFLQVFRENNRAVRLYQKLGFSFKERLDTYYWEF